MIIVVRQSSPRTAKVTNRPIVLAAQNKYLIPRMAQYLRPAHYNPSRWGTVDPLREKQTLVTGTDGYW
jgi:hypothetical protein